MGYFAQKLLRVTRDIERHFNGSHQSLSEGGQPAAEFVCLVCSVFALDARVAAAAEMLKCKLLYSLRKGHENSTQNSTTFRSLVIPPLACSSCKGVHGTYAMVYGEPIHCIECGAPCETA